MKRTKWNNYFYSIITYVAAIFLLAATLLFCISVISDIYLQMNESATSNLLNTTKVIESNLENYIQKDFESLNVIGELYKNGFLMEGEAFEALRETMEFETIIFLEASSPEISEKTWYKEWEPEQAGYSDAYYGASGRLQTTLWLPVYIEDEFAGTVFGDVLLTKYYSASVFTFYEGKGRTYLFNRKDGKWILRSMGTDGVAKRQNDIYSFLTESGNNTEDVNAFQRAIEQGKTGTAVFDFNGESSYICFMPLYSSKEWYVVTVIARDVLLRESNQVQRMIQMLLAAFCCTILIGAVVFFRWQNRKNKLNEANYREALFTNVFSNVDSVFLIYDNKKRETAFVSDNVDRILGLNRQTLKEETAELFDWCGIRPGDSLRKDFLEGALDKSEAREVCVENEMGLKSRFMRLELIPADMDQSIVMLTDITADKDIQNSLREAMRRAETAGRAKNDFLSAMSHDLRTPMNGVIGMTAIAAAHLDDKSRVKDCLNKINEASAHLLSLINEILDMSKIESGKMELFDEPFNLGQLIQEVLNMNLSGIKQKNHSIQVHIQSMEHEQVIGDPVRMQRVVANLLSNAIKYTPEGGSIYISLEEKAPEIKGYGCYELIIKDNGIGMSPEFQKKLFQPFEREDDVRLKKIQGTGLGMSIVKNIVSLMMGRIDVESRKNQGTLFRVTVNLKLDEYLYTPSEKLENLPVLVVDDNLIICETVTDMLFDIGMTGEWVDNGMSAVRMVAERHQRREDYLAVLIDWKMPEMDGVETARRIRREVGDTVPVIILTAYDWSEIETEALEAGIDEFMSKPLYKAKLRQKMLTLVEKPAETLILPDRISSKRIPEGKRILVVEDNPLNREIAVEILSMLKLNVIEAEDGLEAVSMFAESPAGFYDLILMDIRMPRMNGYEASKTIRAMGREDSKTIPIVAMTADAFAEDIQLASDAGMNEHITKPILIEYMLEVLEKLLPGR